MNMKSFFWVATFATFVFYSAVIEAMPQSLNKEQPASQKVSDVSEQEDPYLWLEDVTGDRSLDWVRERNKTTQTHFESSSQFTSLNQDLIKILDSDERIPFISKAGEYYYNFWRDKDHVRGIWRRTSLDEYRKGEPKWEIVLDLDAVATDENENWVWGGSSILRPDCNRALVSLSRGGADASVSREFDLTTKTFVKDGFVRAESKGGMGWIDQNRVFVYTDFGEGSMTSSGYPRIAKLWQRGTPLSSAEVVYEGTSEDMSIRASHDNSPGFERNFVSRNIAFYNNELYLLHDDGTLQKIEAQNSASKGVFQQYLMLELRESWEVGDKTYSAGSLLIADFDRFMAGEREFDVVFEPTETSSLAGYSATKDYIILNVLEDVKNVVYVLKKDGDEWNKSPMKGAPAIGTVGVRPIDPDHSNAFWMTSSGYLNPTTLYYGSEIGAEPELLKQLTPLYDATGLKVEQHFATSKDGTRVPYFMVSKQDLKLDGSNPTLLYGYGGFEISLTPGYSASVGKAWTSQGGVYVVANIRGGGEYGPRWHQAALKQNRLRAYEDFAAVGEDLIARKVTSRQRLGIQGGSNGGLLVGNMVALYPDLFAAAVCQVPLLDMKRYHLLLAGASWMAEYGNPDAGDWDFIRTYSPYQNIRKETKYPAVLFTTSTRDDRVHPGHARKMMAMMEAQGHDVTYYENIEGGHGGAANNKQRTYMQSLAYVFLRERLFGEQ